VTPRRTFACSRIPGAAQSAILRGLRLRLLREIW
jgi:hypothetical protein